MNLLKSIIHFHRSLRSSKENDARILSLYIHKPSPFSKELDVTIKVNVVDLSAIIQTFARYDYMIKATYMDQSQIKGLFDDRYDQFMRYINV